ncbi:hypothetical protein [Dyella mobilis]|uniref:Uncharacterized protein n=1 Tax=Dyella mobilis TaxID=1849582 RepID=A0ABS2KK18_9GAMM|nr:hypothetical protein [Dyella mobilis]MBM7131142.1 hypothetical protein [Dyella mobilis]
MADANRGLALERLHLSSRSLRFVKLLDAPEALRYLFNQPTSFYVRGYPLNPGQWEELHPRVVLPTWEHSGAIYGVDIAADPPVFISFYRELPGDVEIHGTSIFHALMHVLCLHVWEYGGGVAEAEQAIGFAKELAFPAVDRLAALFRNQRASAEEIAGYVSELDCFLSSRLDEAHPPSDA